MAEPMVTITAARLAALEAAEARLAIQRVKNTNTVKQCINKNRDAYNARRRELYHLKKINETDASGVD